MISASGRGTHTSGPKDTLPVRSIFSHRFSLTPPSDKGNCKSRHKQVPAPALFCVWTSEEMKLWKDFPVRTLCISVDSLSWWAGAGGCASRRPHRQILQGPIYLFAHIYRYMICIYLYLKIWGPPEGCLMNISFFRSPDLLPPNFFLFLLLSWVVVDLKTQLADMVTEKKDNEGSYLWVRAVGTDEWAPGDCVKDTIQEGG